VGRALTQPTPVAAQGGGEIAQLCQDPAFREEPAANVVSDLGGPIALGSSGDCVSLIQTRILNCANSSRTIILTCRNPDAVAAFGNSGRCVAAFNASGH